MNQDCGCNKTLEVLTALGAKHAALMHARGAAANPNGWSATDWLLHMAEEEKLLFKYFPTQTANSLIADHEVFRDQLKRYGAIDPALIKLHSQVEEDTINDLF